MPVLRDEMFNVLRQTVTMMQDSDTANCVIRPEVELSADLMADGKSFIEARGLMAAFGFLEEPDDKRETVIIVSRSDAALSGWLQNATAAKHFRLLGVQ